MPRDAPALLITVLITLLAGAAVAPHAAPSADDRAEVVIRHISLVDVRQGVVLPAHDLVIRGTRIDSVRPSGGVLPPAKTVIEGRGKFALPGLIDAHVSLARHTRDTTAALLVSGVTAVRDLGTDPARIAEWRRALAYGQMYAPRIARACGATPDSAAGAAATGRGAAEPGCGPIAAPAASALAALQHEAARLQASGGAGVTSGAPEGGLHDALERIVRASGFTPLAALRAATIETAQVLGLSDLGELAAGKGADILILTANPLADLRNARAIDAVVFRGEALTRAHLNLLVRGTRPTRQ
jgi:imidazolonepropionase-like amidohydrolase